MKEFFEESEVGLLITRETYNPKKGLFTRQSFYNGKLEPGIYKKYMSERDFLALPYSGEFHEED